MDKSLQRIGTDYLDIFFCHRFDEETSLEETVRALDDLVHQGKILYWGTSEWTGAQIQAAMDLCEKYNLHKPIVEQPHYNLLVRDKVENDVEPVTTANGMGLVVWSPLASGILTGKYDKAIPEDSRLAQIDWLRNSILGGEDDPLPKVRAIKPVADKLGISRAQLALAWTLHKPGITSAIMGASKPSQLDDNLKALEVTLDEATLTEIESIIA